MEHASIAKRKITKQEEDFFLNYDISQFKDKLSPDIGLKRVSCRSILNDEFYMYLADYRGDDAKLFTSYPKPLFLYEFGLVEIFEIERIKRMNDFTTLEEIEDILLNELFSFTRDFFANPKKNNELSFFKAIKAPYDDVFLNSMIKMLKNNYPFSTLDKEYSIAHADNLPNRLRYILDAIIELLESKDFSDDKDNLKLEKFFNTAFFDTPTKEDVCILDSSRLAFVSLVAKYQELKKVPNKKQKTQKLEIQNKTNKNTKEHKKMNLSKIFPNLQIGEIKTNEVKMSIYGLAYRGEDEKFFSFLNDDKVDVTEMLLDFGGVFALPTMLDAVQPNDVIIRDNKFFKVKKINPKTLTGIDLKHGEEKIIYPAKNIFGFNMVSKIVDMMSLMGGMNGTPTDPNNAQSSGQINPFSNMTSNPMMMMMMMGGGGGMFDNSDEDFGDEQSGGMGGMFKMMMMTQMMGGMTGGLPIANGFPTPNLPDVNNQSNVDENV